MNHYFLRTDRLILRKLREEDFPDYAVYAVDDEMSRMMGRALLKTEADIRQNFNWLKDHEPPGRARSGCWTSAAPFSR